MNSKSERNCKRKESSEKISPKSDQPMKKSAIVLTTKLDQTRGEINREQITWVPSSILCAVARFFGEDHLGQLLEAGVQPPPPPPRMPVSSPFPPWQPGERPRRRRPTSAGDPLLSAAGPPSPISSLSPSARSFSLSLPSSLSCKDRSMGSPFACSSPPPPEKLRKLPRVGIIVQILLKKKAAPPLQAG